MNRPKGRPKVKRRFTVHQLQQLLSKYTSQKNKLKKEYKAAIEPLNKRIYNIRVVLKNNLETKNKMRYIHYLICKHFKIKRRGSSVVIAKSKDYTTPRHIFCKYLLEECGISGAIITKYLNIGGSRQYATFARREFNRSLKNHPEKSKMYHDFKAYAKERNEKQDYLLFGLKKAPIRTY